MRALLSMMAGLALLCPAGSSQAATVAATPLVFSAPFTTSGALIEDDANTVMHCLGEDFSGGTLTCRVIGAMSTTGSPTAASVSPLYPSGWTATARAGISFSAGAKFSLSGATALNVAGDVSACAVFADSSTVEGVLVQGGTYNSTGGWALATYGGDHAYFDAYQNGGAGFIRATTTNVSRPGVNIVCGGRLASNSTNYVKGNGGSYIASGNTAYLTGGSGAAIGSGGTGSFTGTIYEIWVTTTAPSDALFTKIQRRILSHVASAGETLTATRSTSNSYLDTASGNLYTAPVNTLRMTSLGALLENGGTNLEIRSEAFDNAAHTATNVTVTADSTVAPDTATTADTLAGTGAGGVVRTTTGITPALVVHTGSVYLKVTGASQATALKVRDTNGNAAATWAALTPYADGTYIVPQVAQANNHFYMVTAHTTGSSGGVQPTWPTAPAGTVVDGGVTWTEQGLLDHCSTTPTAITTWTRFSCTGSTVPSTNNRFGLFIYPGGTGGTGTVIAWGAQLEANGFPTSYIPTAGTSVARGADDLSATDPLTFGETSWCVTGTYVPESSKSWHTSSVGAWLWSIGAVATANSASAFMLNDGNLYFDTWDAAAAQKRSVWTTGFSAGSQHTITACNDNGTPRLCVDGVAKTLTISGAGTGVLQTQPATLRIGVDSSGRVFDGYVSQFSISRRGVCPN